MIRTKLGIDVSGVICIKTDAATGGGVVSTWGSGREKNFGGVASLPTNSLGRKQRCEISAKVNLQPNHLASC